MYQINVIQYYDNHYNNLPNNRTFTIKRFDRINDALREIDNLKNLLFTSNDKLFESQRLDKTIYSLIQTNFRNGIKHSIHIIEQ